MSRALLTLIARSPPFCKILADGPAILLAPRSEALDSVCLLCSCCFRGTSSGVFHPRVLESSLSPSHASALLHRERRFGLLCTHTLEQTADPTVKDRQPRLPCLHICEPSQVSFRSNVTADSQVYSERRASSNVLTSSTDPLCEK